MREITPRHFAVQGTPTDCVIMGLRTVMTDKRPDLILSGVNRGQNVAEDVTYSGTIAAAMEGTLLGVPSIALSQSYGGVETRERPHWDSSETHAPAVIEKILALGIPEGVLINVNFPNCPAADVKGYAVTSQGRRDANLIRVEQRRDGRAIPYYWLMFQTAGLHAGRRQRPRGIGVEQGIDHAAETRFDRRGGAQPLRQGFRVGASASRPTKGRRSAAWRPPLRGELERWPPGR